MLTYRRADALALNEGARARRLEAGELGESKLFMTENGAREFSINERIYFLQNDKDLGVKNGTLGTVKSFQGNWLCIQLDKEENGKKREVRVNTKEYTQLEYGYAATIHKSQGATVDKAYLWASPYCDAHATYVGMSRHRDSVQVYWSLDRFDNWQKMCNTLSRDRGKDMSTDYGMEQNTAAIPEMKLTSDRTVNVRQSQEVVKQPSSMKDLDAFVRQFEAQNPELARSLQEKLDPKLHYEKEVQQQINHFERLEKVAENKLDPKAQEAVKSYAITLSKDEPFMDHIKQQNGKLFERLQSHVKAH